MTKTLVGFQIVSFHVARPLQSVDTANFKGRQQLRASRTRYLYTATLAQGISSLTHDIVRDSRPDAICQT